MKLFTVLLLVMFVSLSISSQTRNIPKSKNAAPYFSVAPSGGAVFPLDKLMRNNFKPGWLAGLDLNYRINNEVGIYARFNYMNMSSKTTGDKAGSYIEGSFGPRYFFTHPKLRSQIMLEAGVGVYTFSQHNDVPSIGVNAQDIEEIKGTKVGINGGVGATLAVSKQLDINMKGKYHTIFVPNGTISLLTVSGGLEFRFR